MGETGPLAARLPPRLMAVLTVLVMAAATLSLSLVSSASHCSVGDISSALGALEDSDVDAAHEALHSDLSQRGVLQSGIHAEGDMDIAEDFGYLFDHATCSFYHPAVGPPSTTTSSTTTTIHGSFGDDEGSVFEEDIEWLVGEGITKGCNPPLNNLYCPEDPVTRGQMAAFIHRALPDLAVTQESEFTDTDESVFAADIEWLANAGMTKGCNPPRNDLYCPEAIVTRGQMAAFLVRGLGYTDRDLDAFIDDDGSVFEADSERLAAAGVTKGCNPPSNDRYCPSDPVTRGQMAAFLRRALESR